MADRSPLGHEGQQAHLMLTCQVFRDMQVADGRPLARRVGPLGSKDEEPQRKTNPTSLGPKINSPTPPAPIAVSRTTPAATSLATLASGWYSAVTRSTSDSIMVFTISALSTRAIVTASTAHSTQLNLSSSPARVAAVPMATCIRKLRWVRKQ